MGICECLKDIIIHCQIWLPEAVYVVCIWWTMMDRYNHNYIYTQIWLYIHIFLRMAVKLHTLLGEKKTQAAASHLGSSLVSSPQVVPIRGSMDERWIVKRWVAPRISRRRMEGIFMDICTKILLDILAIAWEYHGGYWKFIGMQWIWDIMGCNGDMAVIEWYLFGVCFEGWSLANGVVIPVN